MKNVRRGNDSNSEEERGEAEWIEGGMAVVDRERGRRRAGGDQGRIIFDC